MCYSWEINMELNASFDIPFSNMWGWKGMRTDQWKLMLWKLIQQMRRFPVELLTVVTLLLQI
jgi:hypothetical protein